MFNYKFNWGDPRQRFRVKTGVFFQNLVPNSVCAVININRGSNVNAFCSKFLCEHGVTCNPTQVKVMIKSLNEYLKSIKHLFLNLSLNNWVLNTE